MVTQAKFKEVVMSLIFKGKEERDFEKMILNCDSDFEFRYYLFNNLTSIMKWVAAYRAIAMRNPDVVKKKLECAFQNNK